MSDRKILVTGAAGMLGSDWVSYLQSKSHEVIAVDRNRMDVTNLTQVRDRINTDRPNIVIHTAAHTDCDQGELEPEIPYRINAIGTWNVALACADADAELVFISSCGIFDGQKPTPYVEFDAPAPLTHHHRSKVEAEKIVRIQVARHYILRPGWLFGGHAEHDKNFVAKRYREAAGHESMPAARDRFGSPTYTMDFVAAAMKLIEDRVYGTFHVVNQGSCSRWEYVRGCVAACGLATEVVPTDSSHFPRVATVPVSEALETYHLTAHGYPALRPWQQALHEYVGQRLIHELTGVS